MPSKPRALIIGGSVGGLIAYGSLRRAGWDATIFERASGDLAGRGAGLGISQDLVDILRDIGADFTGSAGSAHESYVWLKRDGAVGFENVRPTVGSTWPRVYQPLRAIAPPDAYRQGMNLVRVEQDAASVTAHFADGSHETADLLVASDGVFSTVRKQFLPDVDPVYASYVAWRGIAEEAVMSQAALDAIEHHIVYCFPWGKMLLTMTVPGAGDRLTARVLAGGDGSVSPLTAELYRVESGAFPSTPEGRVARRLGSASGTAAILALGNAGLKSGTPYLLRLSGNRVPLGYEIALNFGASADGAEGAGHNDTRDEAFVVAGTEIVRAHV